MSSQGGADGSWWDEVYVGPRDEVPDMPRADSGDGTVDDWFDAISGVFAGPGAGAGGADRVSDAAPDPAPETAPEPASKPGHADTWDGGVRDRVEREGRKGSDRDASGRDVLEPEPEDIDSSDIDSSGPPTLIEDAVPTLPSPPAVPRPPTMPTVSRVPRPPALPPLPVRPPRVPSPTAAAPGAPSSPASPVPDPRVAAPPAPAAAPSPPTPTPRVPPITSVPPARSAPPAPSAAAQPVESAPTVPLPHIGERPPIYDPEPTALPAGDPEQLSALVPDTVLDGARYGTMTLRAVSVRGDSARYRGDARGDRLLTVRFGEGSDALLLVALASPALDDDPAVAEDACRQLAAAVGRSRAELLGDLRMGAQEGLRYGLQRLMARATVRLCRIQPGSAGPGGALHALIAPLDPTSRLRAGFGVGPGGLLLLGDDAWYDAYAGRRLAPAERAEPGSAAGRGRRDDDRFRFRVVVPEPGDVLLLCSDGLAQPLREEPAVSDFLADHWSHPHPPGMVDFLRHVQVRAKGYAADRTAAAVWED